MKLSKIKEKFEGWGKNVMADERWASSRMVAEYKTVHLHSEKVNAVAKFVLVVLNIPVLTFNMRK